MTVYDVTKEINLINQKLIELARERKKLITKKDLLTQQKANLSDNSESILTPFSVDQKINIFKELFKGRTDVFANRWQNSAGRNGYSVSCHNEWKQGLCNKPRTKCQACLNQKYKSLDDHVIYDHLAGKLVVGLYPLLTDNTCHLLAVDFDKSDWQEAVKAVSQICFQYSIPHAVEISRSGNGAHLWIFFSETVLAKKARLLGFGLLDKAMEIYAKLSFESYDRLFPNQDLMPEGGFGNLIALPLQHQARQKGNSQFVDINLTPYLDQWYFLSQMKLISSKQLNKLSPQSQKIVDDLLPWEQGVNIKLTKIENCPEQVALIKANHIYIKLDKLPSVLLARLKRLASFSNPVFFKTQALRFSTHGIPRYITCARIE